MEHSDFHQSTIINRQSSIHSRLVRVEYMRKSTRGYGIVVGALFWMILLTGWAFAGEDVAWQHLLTRYTIIRYQSKTDLLKFDRSIDWSPGQWGIKSLFASTSPKVRTQKLIEKIDALYKRVQEILDMRKRAKKAIIQIYPNREQLRKAHIQYVKVEGHSRAWYLFKSRTIYLNVRDLHEGILAHEMGHHIIDHYFGVRPPAASAEILCRYVDKHLFD